MSINQILKKEFFLFLWISSSIALGQESETNVSEKLYPCGAGIRHEKVNLNYSHGSDSIIFSYEDLKAPKNHPFRNRSESVQTYQGTESYQTTSPVIWNTQANNISVQLNTESYGSSYFIELCYLQNPMHLSAAHGYYSLQTEIHLPGSKSYRFDSKLTVQMNVKCSLSDRMPQNISSELDSSSSIFFNFFYDSYPMGIHDGPIQWKLPINQNQAHFPQACLVRIYFHELASEQRKNKLQIQEIETVTTIQKEHDEFMD